MKKGRALRSLARRLAQLGLGLGSALGVALALSRHWLPKLFASDPAVLARLSQLMVRALTYFAVRTRSIDQSITAIHPNAFHQSPRHIAIHRSSSASNSPWSR